MARYWSTDDMVRYADTADKYSRLQAIIKNTSELLDYRLAGDEESAVIITDTEVSPMVYHTVAGLLAARDIEPTINIIPQLSVPNEEPPQSVADGLPATDLIVNMCVYTLTHTDAIEHPTLELDIPYLLLADPTEDTFSRGMMAADPEEVDHFTERVATVLQEGTDVRVTSPHGTDVELNTAGRDQVIVRYPLGETATCPVEESVSGTVVHDSFMMGVGILEDPIRWEIEEGRIVSIEGGREAQKLREYVEEHGDDNSYWIGEFSVMTHPTARPNGNYIEHKEVEGGVHFAMGDGRDLGGQYTSSLHLDGIQLEPTVTVDGETLVEDGQFVEATLPDEPRLTEGMRTG